MPIVHFNGAQIPRWSHNDRDGFVIADKISAVGEGVVYLECGARAEASDALMASGPSNVGDYLVFDGDDETLVDGAAFLARSKRAPAEMVDMTPAWPVVEPMAVEPVVVAVPIEAVA